MLFESFFKFFFKNFGRSFQKLSFHSLTIYIIPYNAVNVHSFMKNNPIDMKYLSHLI